MKFIYFLLLFFLLTACGSSTDTEVQVELFKVSDGTTSIGTVVASDTPYGLLLIPNLSDVSEGIHGFHIHAHPSCDHEGSDAGTHWDPQNTSEHLGPYNSSGHQGDLPALTADVSGNITTPVLAPRLKVSDLIGHSFILHNGGDNYSDLPTVNGGGGTKYACGVIQ